MKRCLAFSLLFLLMACGGPQNSKPPTEEPPKPPAEEIKETVSFQLSLVGIKAVDADGNDVTVEGLPITGPKVIIDMPDDTE